MDDEFGSTERDDERGDIALTEVNVKNSDGEDLLRAYMTARNKTGYMQDCFGSGRRSRSFHVASCSLLVNVVLIVVIASLAASPPRLSSSKSGTQTPAEELVITTLGAVAADEARCSAIGSAVLDEGGSAIDAAVATTLCLGVLHPHSSGIGGGAFLVMRTANGTVEAIDARETAPAAAYRDMYVDGTARSSTFGGSAVAVISELSGLYTAWERHGRLPWSRLVLPAAELADGFVVGKDLAMGIAAEAEALRYFPATAQIFLREEEGGSSSNAGSGNVKYRPLTEGETCVNAQLAVTLRAVAEGGPEILHTGALASALAKDIQDAGGIVTASDLAAYSPRILAPLEHRSSMGVNLIGMPPPSSGAAGVFQILEFLGGYDLPLAAFAGTSESAPGTTSLGAHRTVEAFKHAFAMRMNLGDPDYWPNVTAVLEDMLSPTFNSQLRAATRDDSTLPVEAYGARWSQLDDSGTTHVCVVDAEGAAVALTSTVNTLFGSKLVSPSTGILLNNEMDDFSSPGEPNSYGLAPSEANYIAPGKRPLSSMSPTIVTDSRGVVAVAGASGGPRIITATAQVLLNVSSRSMTPDLPPAFECSRS